MIPKGSINNKSKSCLKLSLTAFLVFSILSFATADQEKLDLHGSLDRAIKNNPRLLTAQKELLIAKSQIAQAKSLFYPKVNLSLNYVHYRNETLGATSEDFGNAILEAPIVDENGVRGNPLANNLYLGRIDFKQTLFAGGKLNYTFKRSQANLRQADSFYDSLKRNIEFETASNFFRLIAIRDKRKLIQDTILDIEKLKNNLSDGFTGLLIDHQLSELKSTDSSLAQEQSKVRLDYFQSMGVELFSDIDVDGGMAVPTLTTDFQALLAWAKENRSELRSNLLQEEVDQLSVDLSLAERYPVFLLGGTYEFRNKDFPLNETNWSTALSMNIPIFDGFSSLARIHETKYRRDQSRLNRIQLEDQVDKEVRGAYNQFQLEYKEWLRNQDELKKLSKVSSLSSSRPLSEKVNLALWELGVKKSALDITLQLNLAKAELERAVGRSIP